MAKKGKTGFEESEGSKAKRARKQAKAKEGLRDPNRGRSPK